jgi:hypothetical protein
MGIPETIFVIAILALLASWLGGGRKWAFRTMLSMLILALLVGCGVLLYAYWTGKSAERRAQKLHECAIAKVADANCDVVSPKGTMRCPAYMLFDDPTPQQEEEAMAAAERECRAEMNRTEKSLHEQISEYRREHGIKEPAKSVDYDALAKKAGAIKSTLDPAACAAKVRKAYPGAYNDLDDATLMRKVLAKYPKYCETNSGDPPGWEPVIEGIR